MRAISMRLLAIVFGFLLSSAGGYWLGFSMGPEPWDRQISQVEVSLDGLFRADETRRGVGHRDVVLAYRVALDDLRAGIYDRYASSGFEVSVTRDPLLGDRVTLVGSSPDARVNSDELALYVAELLERFEFMPLAQGDVETEYETILEGPSRSQLSVVFALGTGFMFLFVVLLGKVVLALFQRVREVGM